MVPPGRRPACVGTHQWSEYYVSRGRPSFGMGEPPPNGKTGGGKSCYSRSEEDELGPFGLVISTAGLVLLVMLEPIIRCC